MCARQKNFGEKTDAATGIGIYNLYTGETEGEDPANISLADIFSSTTGDFSVFLMHFLLKIKLLFEKINTFDIPIYTVVWKERTFFP